MLLTREISIPSRKVLKSHSFHGFASTGLLIPERTGSNAIFGRELVKGWTHPVPRRQKATVSDP